MLVGCELHVRSCIGWGEKWDLETALCIHSRYLAKCDSLISSELAGTYGVPIICSVCVMYRKNAGRIWMSDCSYIWLNLIRFAYIDCACTLLLLSRKSSTWLVAVLQPGVRLQRSAVFLHKRPNTITIVTISSKLLFVLIYVKTFVHWQVHQ